jgi:hypothetical protein
VLESEDGKAFSAETLDAVERLTAEAWKIPYAIRVDSVTNFQHSHASDDDLIVEDLVKHARGRDASYLDEREAVALAEPLLRNQLLTPDGTVTAVNVVLQYPQKHLMEVPEAVAFARNLATGIEADFTAIEVHLTGVSMLNNAFAEGRHGCRRLGRGQAHADLDVRADRDPDARGRRFDSYPDDVA